MCGRYLRGPDETALARLGANVPEPFLKKHSVERQSPCRDKVAKPCERPSANPFHCREAVALKHYVREVAQFMLDHGG